MRKRIIILCFLCMMLCVACGKNENDSEPITKETESMEESIRGIDIQSIYEKIEIGDKAVGFPFKLKELPDNYTMELPDDERQNVDYPIVVNGKRQTGARFIVEFESLDKFYDGTVKQIFWMEMQMDELDEMEAKLSVDGITLGSTMDEVIEKFGEPSEKSSSGSEGQETYLLIYYGEGEEYICFGTDEEKKITFIEIK